MAEQKENSESKKNPVKTIDIRKTEGKQEGRRIVRILSTDIDGSLPVERALRKIKGISFMFARATCIATNIDGTKKVGMISEQDVKTLEEFIKQPKLPEWMFNRRKDVETGGNVHLTMSQLDFRRKEDINVMKRTHSYKGVRHELGQPVRGQRTRSTFRTNKTIGVSKKKAQPAKAKPTAEGKK